MKKRLMKPLLLLLAAAVISAVAMFGCSDGGGGTANSLSLTFTNFQPADYVIGQADFTSGDANQGGSADADTLSWLYGNPVVHNGILYLPDYGNSRVLGFNTIPASNGASADFVLGQPDFTTTGYNLTRDGMKRPQSVSVDNGKFFLTDFRNGRVTIYNTVPTAGPGSPDVVVGQPDFTTDNEDPADSGLDSPEASIAVDGKLIVTDSDNNRVLIWNTIPTVNGTGADIVLGQGDLDHTTVNDDDQDDSEDVTPTARTLSFPSGVWSDGVKLVVLDYDNNRVLIWNTFPTVSFTPAEVVLGQEDFTHNARNDDDQDGVEDATSSARTLYWPFDGVFCLNNQLFVADYGNNRVLIWNTFPTTNFAPADVVLGQADFTYNSENDADQDGSGDGTPSTTTLYGPTGIFVVGSQLIVADCNNFRYLIYDAQ